MNNQDPIPEIEYIHMPERHSVFSTDLLIIYLLRGNCVLNSKSVEFQLAENGYCFINPFTEGFFSIESREISLLIFHIPQKYLRNMPLDEEHSSVSFCFPGGSNLAEKVPNRVHSTLSSLFRIMFYPGGFNKEAFENGLLELWSSLDREHAIEKRENRINKRFENNPRYNSIDSFLREHFRENLTLEKIAAHEYLSPNYLSHFFTRHTGLSLFRYIDLLRLSHAASDLLCEEKTVTEVAIRNGFRNGNYFIQKFRAYYGLTPKKYAKMYSHLPDISFPEITVTDPDQPMARFLSYSEPTDNSLIPAVSDQTERKNVIIDVKQKGTPLRHTWRKLLNIGYAKEGLYAHVQSQILRAQSEIGYEYIRFHGILDDDMFLYYKDSSGNGHLDFSHVDMLLDFIMSAGLKPFIEFSFMPGLLAHNHSSHFDRKSYPSIHKDPDQWLFILRGLLLHWIERYGRETIQDWRFTSFGLSLVTTGLLSYDDFFTIYKSAYQTVKEVDRKLIFGGPGDMSSSIWENGIIYRFLEESKRENCVPDFVTVQNYPYTDITRDNEFLSYSFSQTSAPSVLSGNENYTDTLLKAYTDLLHQYGLEGKEIWFEEWNSTLWQRDISSDSCYKAAWLVKNICENYDQVSAFGYWNLSDFMEERAYFGSVYHGGYGLFTYNGIPKSGWLALLLLKQLGNECLFFDKGCFVTRGPRSDLRIIMYNYAHYDNLYRYRYEILNDPQNAYMVFEKKAKEKRSISISSLDPGKYKLRSYSVSPEHGSSFDLWIRLGSPNNLTDDEYGYLSNMSVPDYKMDILEISGGFQMTYVLQAHEVRLIILEKCS